MSTHSEAHPSFLQHHFSDADQQYQSAKLGMWLFLLTEVLLFGGLFCAYIIYRAWYPDMFYNAHQVLSVKSGAINTVVLIVSSLTIALAIRCVQLGQKKQAIAYLVVTLGCAAIFMVIKYFEYTHKIHLGQLPGKFYTFQDIEGTNPHIFFSAYFLMTGLHGIHVLAGMGAITWVLFKVVNDKVGPEYYTPVEMTGLYWHLVDLIWIYLFPLFYLIG